MSLLGIDVGTTGCKAAAFTEDGRCLASSYREYPTLHPREGWAEIDSARVYASVCEVIREAAAGAGRDPVTALSVSSMGEAAAPVTLDRRILGPAILSSDIRGAEYVDELRARVPQERFYGRNPNILGVNYTMPKLRWLRDHEPDLYRKADRFLLWADLVAFMLGCDPFATYSLANRTLLFDIRKQDWSDELLGLTGVERGKLGACVAGGTVTGRVSAAAARETGLPAGAAIVSGGHDQCCNSLGAGISRAGSAVCGIGTFECITPTYGHVPEAGWMLAHGLNVEHHVLPGLYVSFIYNQAGSLVRWFRDTFASADRRALEAGRDIYDALAGEMPDEPTRLLVLPHFEMTGPPLFTADSSGVIAGLKMNTGRGDILKAIMESVTFFFVDSVEGLREIGVDTSEFVATGGGAKSDRWLQIKADIFGVPFVRPRVTEASTLGAALLAGLGTGVFSSPADGVARFVRRERVFEPDPRRHALYRERLERYRRMYPLMKGFLSGL